MAARKSKKLQKRKRLVKELALLMLARRYLVQFIEEEGFVDENGRVVENLPPIAHDTIALDKKLYNVLNLYKADILESAVLEANKALRGVDIKDRVVSQDMFAVVLLEQYHYRISPKITSLGARSLVDRIMSRLHKALDGMQKERDDAYEFAEKFVDRLLKQE